MEVQTTTGVWGEFDRGIDEKGRVAVPPELRGFLGAEIIVTRGPDQAIVLFPGSTWARIEKQLRTAVLQEDAGFLQRMLSGRVSATLDRQHRLTIPGYLRKWAGITPGNTVVLIGMGVKAELWSRPVWDEFSARFTREQVSRAIRAVGLEELWGT